MKRATSAHDRLRLIVGLAITIVAGLLTLRFKPLPLGPPGIDPGWQWVVNVWANEGWAFGRDVVFTYGPLGWLATPQDCSHNLVLAGLFRVLLQVVLFAAAAGILRHERRPLLAAVTFAVLWMVANAVGLRFEGWLCLVVAAALVHAIQRGATWSAGFAGAIAGLSSMIKASLGVATLTTVAIAIALIWRRRDRRTAVVTAGAAVLTALGLAAVLFPSSGVFFSWVWHSREVVSGYSAASSILGPFAPLLTGFFLLVASVAGGLLGARRSAGFAVAAAVLAPSLLIQFRLAFVRQDGHQYLFVPFVIAMLGVAGLSTSRRPAQLGLLAGGIGALLLGSLSGALSTPTASLPRTLVDGLPGPGGISRMLHLAHTQQQLKQTSVRNLEPLLLPDTWVELMRTAANGMTVVPWEIMYAPANDVPFRPLRSMQLYSAYTDKLDRWTAAGLTTADGPDFVIDDFAPVGKRRALLDAPATWRALLTHFELEIFDPERRILLLHRRPQPKVERWRDLGSGMLEIGGPGVQVPDPASMVFAEVDVKLNTFGLLNKSIFRVPLLMAVFHRLDGTSSWARLIPATAGNRILVSRFPHDINDYAGLWQGLPPIPVIRLQIVGPGSSHYQSEVAIRWRALEQ